jgi:secreted PhoX family phosphatase
MSVSRRRFLTLAGTTAAGVTMVSPLEALYARVANGQGVRGVGYGPLSPQMPTNASDLRGVVVGGIDLGSTPILQLPNGFNYTAISITGQPMDDGNPVPGSHDGMAAFPGPNNTTILVRNHELNLGSPQSVRVSKLYDQVGGGTTTLVVGANRQVLRQFGSLGGTVRNCAGGPTPWGSWVSCEENLDLPGTRGATKKHGYNFEVPVTVDMAVADPVPLVAMGRFNHEAVAVDPATGWVYQTEDERNSCFYRFRPNQPGNLRSGGTLEALVVQGAPADTRKGYLGFKNVPLSTSWVTIDNVDPATNDPASSVRAQAQAKGAAIFARGEGAWYGNGVIYFNCTNGGDAGFGQVFAYNPRNEKLVLGVESPGQGVLDFPDNITVAPFGHLFLCEDGDGDSYVVGVNRAGELYQFAKNNINDSEYAGACFSPDGQTLFVNIQTPGITLAIWGPWAASRG